MKENVQLTMKDIAREFNTSVATVSRALKDSPRISEEKRRAIQQYAKEHNFFPNFLAESLRNSKVMQPKIIGVIVPELAHYYFSTVLAGIEEEARARDYRIMVAQSNEKYEREVKICQSFYENKVCGIIVSQAKDTTKYDHFNQLLQSGVPLVFYDRICTGVNADRVVVDDYQGAFNAVSHMIETGCRRIAFFGSPMTLEISKNRFNGYKDALERHGIEFDEKLALFCDNRSDAEVITPELMKKDDHPDAFDAVDAAKRDVLTIYRNDIFNYASEIADKVVSVFDQIPPQLSTHEKKFRLSALKPGAKYRDWDDAFFWLKDARVVNIFYQAPDTNLQE